MVFCPTSKLAPPSDMLSQVRDGKMIGSDGDPGADGDREVMFLIGTEMDFVSNEVGNEFPGR